MGLRSKAKMTGMVKVIVVGRDGEIKTFPRSWIRRLLNLPPKQMVFIHHNTITAEGDAMIADWMLATPTKTKITSVNGYMQVGTGWTGNSPKLNTRCNTSTGSFQKIDTGYPNVSGTSITYKATFPIGSLNASNINEACLLNGNTGTATSLAYAQITPAANVTENDSLAIEWTITVTGS